MGKVETMLAQQESSLGTSAEERGEKEPDGGAPDEAEQIESIDESQEVSVIRTEGEV